MRWLLPFVISGWCFFCFLFFFFGGGGVNGFCHPLQFLVFVLPLFLSASLLYRVLFFCRVGVASLLGAWFPAFVHSSSQTRKVWESWQSEGAEHRNR